MRDETRSLSAGLPTLPMPPPRWCPSHCIWLQCGHLSATGHQHGTPPQRRNVCDSPTINPGANTDPVRVHREHRAGTVTCHVFCDAVTAAWRAYPRASIPCAAECRLQTSPTRHGRELSSMKLLSSRLVQHSDRAMALAHLICVSCCNATLSCGWQAQLPIGNGHGIRHISSI